MLTDPIRRLANGSIDHNHYTREGRRLRAETQREFLKGWRGVIWPLFALAIVLAPALAGGVYRYARWNATTASRAVEASIERNVQALNRSRAW